MSLNVFKNKQEKLSWTNQSSQFKIVFKAIVLNQHTIEPGMNIHTKTNGANSLDINISVHSQLVLDKVLKKTQ